MTVLELPARTRRDAARLPTVRLPRTPHRLALLVAAGVALFLVPWCLALAQSLPAVATVPHWSAAWVGLDSGEAIAAALTAVLLLRRDPRAALSASAGAALLLADAWFDIATSAGAGLAIAIAEAVLVELPLAVAALWYAARVVKLAAAPPA